jgi:hypothetical protein
MALSAADIHAAFDALSEELAQRGAQAEIVIVGGAALVLLFGARETTKDVDAYFVRPEASVVRHAAEQVLHESPSLVVRSASIAQLLAMKLAAWRDAIDRKDATLLLSQMHGTADQIWSEVEPYVPAGQRDKAPYAFEDLWEAVHGPL